jgi:hypothetical protein
MANPTEFYNNTLVPMVVEQTARASAPSTSIHAC